ncbi:GTPase ERA-like, chloroplastic isoform X2 [Zingiber officinale]|uniref:GTPase ERA-like, chloroplastic isoform X2 n=1 Tax=Zingiber officinale TaxID=94328 RepID=UPI001C4B3C9D|nr:GTPase ERA-like, chloroplastic isoform X2 [Zingiber officinale]
MEPELAHRIYAPPPPPPPPPSLPSRDRCATMLHLSPYLPSSSSRFFHCEISLPSFRSSRSQFRPYVAKLSASLELERRYSCARASDEEELEEGTLSSSSSGYPSASLLSLSEKPDRNFALLDEYELEELDSESSTCPNHRTGYVAVLGKPNVGKSTLSNQMIGQKLSIVTEKPQTTRHRILGICSGPEYQMILYDTPGVIEKKMHMLDSMMMNNVRNAAINADCVLVVVDASKVPQKIDDVLEGIGTFRSNLPILLVLNKKDLIKPGEIAKRLETFTFCSGTRSLLMWMMSYLMQDIASEHPERFFVAEIVREKIFMQYRNEVPYACQVNVLNYISRPTSKDFIQVEIVVEKDSQKIILIGKGGKALKVLATAARLDIEDFLQKKIFLEVEVKVKENWRQDEGLLRYYGYGGQIRAL